MLSHLISLTLLIPQQWTPPVPQRDVADSGVIATNQRVTPAGVGTSFTGRVTGVRFGAAPGEVWALVSGSAYHLGWSDNRVLARGVVTGRAGIQGLVLDPVTHRAIAASVGQTAPPAPSRIPGVTPPAAPRVAHLTAFADDARDVAPAVFVSAPLGDFITGAPAVASTANLSRHRVAVVPLTAQDKLAIVDADSGALLGSVALGVAPVASAISADGATAWVSVMGGRKPGARDRSASQCCDPAAERVRVDARGIAEAGQVTRVDLVTQRVVASVAVGRHPTALAWDATRQRLYVAEGNSDAIAIIDTRANRLVRTLSIAPFRERRIGLSPTAIAISSDGRALYVALGGINAVAVYRVAPGDSAPMLRGLIPTAWFPSSLDLSADGRHLAIGALLGIGAGEGTTGGSPGKRARYVFAERGTVHVVEIPGDAQLAAYTTAVASNSHLTIASRGTDATPVTSTIARAVPLRPGDPSLIHHVVYIIRENRTYDQVLGDLGRGDGDSSLVIYGRDVTPNAHVLSEQFVTLDRTFASGGNSADGHLWMTQANETEYSMWPLYIGRSYPFDGTDPLAYSSGGFLWDAAASKGLSVSVFGEYAPAGSDSVPSRRAGMMAAFREHGRQPDAPARFREMLRAKYRTTSEIPSLDKVLVREYPGWTLEVPDVVMASDILAHLSDWEERRSMPSLVIVILPADHTVGKSPEWCTPRACVADNDLALGMTVEGLSHSSFWKDMAILVMEDDAQNGVDHVDGHRTVALAISPYAKRGVVDHTFYNQPSMVKTIELMLGLPALSLFDLVATDMRASFIAEGEQPDVTPYTAITPSQSLYEVNQRVGDIRGADAAVRRRAALASARMRFDGPDQAPSEQLNRILWGDARGWRAPYPAVKRSLFFPLALDIEDEDRETRPR